MAAHRLSDEVSPGDTVARLGGDEFVLACEFGPMPVEEAAEALARRLIERLGEPTDIDGHEVVVQASIGVTFAGADSTPGSLLRDADLAMYQAKRAGRGTWALFTPMLRTRALERLDMEGELRRAIGTDEIRSFFQPVFDLRTGCAVGFEALARWRRHGRMVSPNAFLEMAEETGLVIPLTERGRLGRSDRDGPMARREPRRSPGSLAVDQCVGASHHGGRIHRLGRAGWSTKPASNSPRSCWS